MKTFLAYLLLIYGYFTVELLNKQAI